MRFTDIMLVIPDLPLAVVMVALTQPSLGNIIFVIGILGWTSTARLVRSQTLSVKERKFVLRAKAIGAGNAHIIRRHILPLVLPADGGEFGAGHFTRDPGRKHAQLSGSGRPYMISWGQMLNFAFTRGGVSSGAWWALLAARARDRLGGAWA